MDQSSEIEAELKALRNLADNKQNTQNTIEIIAHYFEEQNLSDAKIGNFTLFSNFTID
jgi:hypothetical protein